MKKPKEKFFYFSSLISIIFGVVYMNERNKKVINLVQKILITKNSIPSTTIYLLDVKKEPPSSKSINRIFGPPIGIDDDSWPIYKEMKNLAQEASKEYDGDSRMDHVFTLNLQDLQLNIPATVQALAVFLSDYVYNEAWEPNSKHIKVITLSKDDLSKGVYQGNLPKKMLKKATTFQLIPVKVPENIFFSPFERELDEDDPFTQLNDALLNAGYIGGNPIWIQNDESPNTPFILQFDESFADINLGDAGIMYVFLSTAFWQCV